MKPDGTPTVDEILVMVDQLQAFEKQQLLERIYRGGMKTIYERYNFPRLCYS